MKAYTDLEQSKKLAELMSIETYADMRYHTISNCNPYPCDEIVYTVDFGKASYNDIPCWSLSALLGILPSGKALIHDKGNFGYKCICNNMDTYFHNNPVDACVELIVKLKEQNQL